MNTRQRKRLRDQEIKILDLNGNIFKVGSYYRLYLKFPFKSGTQKYTRDLIADKAFNLIHTSKGNWYAVWWIDYLDMYLLRKLEPLSYDESKDIEKAYLYGKKRRY